MHKAVSSSSHRCDVRFVLGAESRTSAADPTVLLRLSVSSIRNQPGSFHFFTWQPPVGCRKLLHLQEPAVLPLEQKYTKLPPKTHGGIWPQPPLEQSHCQRHSPSLHETWTAPCPSRSCPGLIQSTEHTVCPQLR